MKFIYTKDKATCDKLVAQGITLMSEKNGLYVLINEQPHFDFSVVDQSQIAFSNMLTF